MARKFTYKRQVVLARCNNECAFCKCKLTDSNGPTQATIDHILPKAFGGSDAYWNLRALCAKCNSSRGHGTPEEIDALLVWAEEQKNLILSTKIRHIKSSGQEYVTVSTPDTKYTVAIRKPMMYKLREKLDAVLARLSDVGTDA